VQFLDWVQRSRIEAFTQLSHKMHCLDIKFSCATPILKSLHLKTTGEGACQYWPSGSTSCFVQKNLLHGIQYAVSGNTIHLYVVLVSCVKIAQYGIFVQLFLCSMLWVAILSICMLYWLAVSKWHSMVFLCSYFQ